MKRHDKAPNGHFAEGLILYGNLESGASASQGFILEPPDLQHASVSLQNEFQDKLRIFLASLGPKQCVQLQWTCNSDYQQELIRYHQQTTKAQDTYIRAVREERFSRYWQRLVDRTLRREQLVLFVSQEIETSPTPLQSREGLLDYLPHHGDRWRGYTHCRQRIALGCDQRHHHPTKHGHDPSDRSKHHLQSVGCLANQPNQSSGSNHGPSDGGND